MPAATVAQGTAAEQLHCSRFSHSPAAQSAERVLPYDCAGTRSGRRQLPDRHLVHSGTLVAWPKRKTDNAEHASRDTPLDSLRYVVLDTELTSLDHRKNRLLSVGAIAMQGASVVLGEQFYRMVNPQVEIPAESIVVHHILDKDVEGAEHTSKTLEELTQFIGEAVLIGHFTQIDLKILRKEMSQTGHTLTNPAV